MAKVGVVNTNSNWMLSLSVDNLIRYCGKSRGSC